MKSIFKVPIILGIPFISSGRALVDMEKGQMKFQLNNEEANYNICRSIRKSGELQSVSSISYKVGNSFEPQIEERLRVEALATVIINFGNDCIEEYDSLVTALDRGDVRFKPNKYELDIRITSPHPRNHL